MIECPAEPDRPFIIQGRLRSVDGRNILFGPARRAIFTLNDTAADIWRAVEEGVPPRIIAAEIAASGADPRDARGHVEAAIEYWEQLGLIHPAPPPAATAASTGGVSHTVVVGGISARIEYLAARVAPTAEVFRHLEGAESGNGLLFQAMEHRDRIHLFRNGNWVESCSERELPTVMKGQLLSEILGKGGYELALHAGALVHNDRILVLSGMPGAGKTTLTLSLVHAGFGFAGDDVALLDSTGRCTGLPFAPAVKAGAWPLLATNCPDLASAPVYRRPDRRRVRYPVPRAVASSDPRAIGWVVLLRREAGATARLDAVEPAGALRGLLSGSFAVGEELTESAFDVLIRVIEAADIHCLTYSKLDDAVDLIRTLTL